MSTTPTFIAVAGPTGAGKSLLVNRSIEADPENRGVLPLDHYYRTADQVPMYAGYNNFDHPDALALDQLADDMTTLSQGMPITPPSVPEHYTAIRRAKRDDTHAPQPVMFIEGFLSLYNSKIRDLTDYAVWITAEESVRLKRRKERSGLDREYVNEVLLPMEKQFLLTTKQYADSVLDTTKDTPDQAYQKFRRELKTYLK
jgi:uridine kinase